MPLDVKIPPMGESITSGILAKWHVRDGDAVAKDQPLFELETDKITSEGTAEQAGRISLKVEAGAEVRIGQVVATLSSQEEAGRVPAPVGQGPGAGPAAPGSPGAASPAAVSSVVESPAVRRLAAETGVDPSQVSGSGKDGRVTKGDMLAAAGSSTTSPHTQTAAEEKQSRPTTGPSRSGLPAGGPAPAPLPASAPGQAPAPGSAAPAGPAGSAASASAAPTPLEGGLRQTRRKLSPLRQRLAERLVSAQHQAAMLTTFNEVDMSAVMALRARYQEDFVKRNGFKLGFMSFFVKAAVHALREVPAVNAQLDGDTLVLNHFYDIAVAVSTEKGLMVPVIRNCDSLGLAALEKGVADVAARAREGKITLQEIEGGAFTITNGGIFGSMLSTPILNPPQSAILGMHAINDRPVAVGGQVVIRPMMYVALSYDHRVVDGREAVTFLVKVKQAIEDPARLLLGV